MEKICAHSRGDGVRAYLRNVIQPHRRPQVRRAQSAHSRTSSARGKNLAAERVDIVCDESRAPGRGELVSEPALLLSSADPARSRLFLFADQTLHRLHARVSW